MRSLSTACVCVLPGDLELNASDVFSSFAWLLVTVYILPPTMELKFAYDSLYLPHLSLPRTSIKLYSFLSLTSTPRSLLKLINTLAQPSSPYTSPQKGWIKVTGN